MRKLSIVAAIAAVALAGACGRTSEGDLTVERPGDVDVTTTKDTIPTPNMPDVDVTTTKDTLIVDRPKVQVKPDSGR